MPPTPPALRIGAIAAALLALAGMAALIGCTATTHLAGGPEGVAAPGRDSAGVVLEVRLRRSAELLDPDGPLRLFDQDLRVEYRVGGTGRSLDAGSVTIDGRPLRRDVDRRGSVTYRLGREEPEGGTRAGGQPWSTIANSGGPRVPAASVRVKLAPFPLVTRPEPGRSVLRTDELSVVMLPPVAGLWHRVTLTGTGDPVTAVDLGEGRWLFPRGSLEDLEPGRARLLIEVESTCGDCPGAERMRVSWGSRTELELALTVL